ncbi:MAG: TIGR03809 family protein [Bradyrhizobium sp.]|nr:TIGR03809 family protein [Bradyrhizobium sp.]
MTHRNDAARGADVLGRWRALAEQRLEHLTELFESGRWRRYYGEFAFLENIREAKHAVETWRALATARPVPEPVIRLTWPPPATPQRRRAVGQAPVAAAKPIELPRAAVAADQASARPAVDLLALERALDVPEQELDLTAIEQRYPLLRNMF